MLKKQKLLEILAKNIYVLKVLTVSDGFIILTVNDSELLDRFYTDKTDAKLTNNDFSPIIPPQLKANRSILVFSIDVIWNWSHQKDTLDKFLEKRIPLISRRNYFFLFNFNILINLIHAFFLMTETIKIISNSSLTPRITYLTEPVRSPTCQRCS